MPNGALTGADRAPAAGETRHVTKQHRELRRRGSMPIASTPRHRDEPYQAFACATRTPECFGCPPQQAFGRYDSARTSTATETGNRAVPVARSNNRRAVEPSAGDAEPHARCRDPARAARTGAAPPCFNPTGTLTPESLECLPRASRGCHSLPGVSTRARRLSGIVRQGRTGPATKPGDHRHRVRRENVRPQGGSPNAAASHRHQTECRVAAPFAASRPIAAAAR